MSTAIHTTVIHITSGSERCSRASSARPTLEANRCLCRPWTLPDGNKLVGGDGLQGIDSAQRPAHFNVCCLLRTEAKMQARVVGEKVAGLTHHFWPLPLPAISDRDAPANGAAVTLRA